MSKPTDLEVMVQMNRNDIANNTETLGMCYSYTGMRKVKKGAIVEMCIPESEMYKIMNRKRVPVLVLIDMDEFSRLKSIDLSNTTTNQNTPSVHSANI